MATNLGYIDRLGAVISNEQGVAAAKKYLPVSKLITDGLRANDLSTKLDAASQANIAWQNLEASIDEDTKAHRAVTSIRKVIEQNLRNLLADIRKLRAAQASAPAPDSNNGGGNGSGGGGNGGGNGEETKIPWLPISIAAGVIGLAMAFSG